MSDLYKEGWEAAIEAAVKTQCGACRLGMPVRLGHRPWSFMKDEYFHLLKENGSTLWDKCGGSDIRALEAPATPNSVTAQPSTKGEEDGSRHAITIAKGNSLD